jgi:cell division protein FtsI/penicillin-binding protein 2
MTSTQTFIRLLLIALFIILSRIWYLSVIQKDFWLQEAQKPQRKVIIEQANRGTIWDRFHKPLAINRLQYSASVYYNHIKQIPSVKWIKIDGKKEKTFPRKEYIKKLSLLLANELDLDPEWVEDTIHSKASLLPHSPYILKENLTETEYYRLRLIEKDWTGLHASIGYERFYPQKKIACDVVGYMGAISSKQYLKIAEKIHTLETYLQDEEAGLDPFLPEGFQNSEEVVLRLNELKEKSYTINDFVGRSGLEKQFEIDLRGSYGKKIYAIDTKGNFLKQVEEKKATSGKSIETALSCELQEFAEKLLAEDEKNRSYYTPFPYIKGGSIVALDPNTGEILALASYPRFDPNDFIPTKNTSAQIEKFHRVSTFLESPSHIARIFEGKEKLGRELYSFTKRKFYQEKKTLSLETFLQYLIPKDSSFQESLKKIATLKDAITLQESFYDLLYYSEQNDPVALIDCLFSQAKGHIPVQKEATFTSIHTSFNKQTEEVEKRKKQLNEYLSSIKNNEDKLFLIDLCKLLVNNYSFSDELVEKIGKMPLNTYWKFTQATHVIEEILVSILQPIFYETHFKEWKKNHWEDFLKEKRQYEKEKKLFPKPYLDYLEKEKRTQFKEFWKKNKCLFLTYFLKKNITDQLVIPPSFERYIQEIELFETNLQEDLPFYPSYLTLKDQVKNLSHNQSFYLFKTIRHFAELDRPLLYSYKRLHKVSSSKELLEKDLAASFYPKNGFGYGLSNAYAQTSPLGSIFKIVTAYAALMQQNLNIQSLNPLTIIDTIEKRGNDTLVAYNEEGVPYFRHYKKGRLPKSAHNGIGKIDLISALAASSNPYFAILACDYLSEPNDLAKAALQLGFGQKTNLSLPGEVKGNVPQDLNQNLTGLFSCAIGQHSLLVTPIQTAQMLSAIANKGKVHNCKIVKGEQDNINSIPLPDSVRKMILTGMKQVLLSEKGSAREEVIHKLKNNPPLKELFHHMKTEFVGKTSTAEILFNPYLLPSTSAQKNKNIWFGSIGFEKDKGFEKPEIVVVVFLKYGDAGKEASPLAAQMIDYYRKLKESHQESSIR